MNYIRLRLEYKNEEMAKAVYESINPDNVDVKEGMSIKCKVEGSTVIVDVTESTNNILRLRNTIDDILASIRLSERVIETIKELP